MRVRLLTNTEMSTYRRCRRKWWLRWYRRLRPVAETAPGPLSLGSRLHEVLAAYYSPGTYPDPAPAWARWWGLAAADREKFAEEPETLIELDKELELGRIMLEGYFEWLETAGPDEYLQVLTAEEERRVALAVVGTPGGEQVQVDLLDKLDTRVNDASAAGGARRFMDHKSSSQPAALLKVAHLDPQLKLYHLIEYLSLLEDPAADADAHTDGAILNVLKKVKRTAAAKPPFYERLEVRHNTETLRSFWQQVHGLAVDLLATEEALTAGQPHHAVAYPNPTRDCSWDCEFFGVCPMLDDGSDAEGQLAVAFRTQHGLAGRYGEALTSDEKEKVGQ